MNEPDIIEQKQQVIKKGNDYLADMAVFAERGLEASPILRDGVIVDIELWPSSKKAQPAGQQ